MKVSKIKMTVLGALMLPLMPALAEEFKEAASVFSVRETLGFILIISSVVIHKQKTIQHYKVGLMLNMKAEHMQVFGHPM